MATIDWSQLVTTEQIAAEELSAATRSAQSQVSTRRLTADGVIGALQDAVDLGEATPEEEAKLLEWKRYRIALIRAPNQPGYPTEIDWPAPPA
ncbi:virus tail fiber assembly protein lambda gpK [Pseudomonas sp. 2848]|uniref:tail fiber assembly protein n=1 Tax=Pseudomonas sp. 2848 TaxID=2183926 RepID=UPI000DB3AD69|nr:tail fiber assembly protein [Pseudomonas sp. 2848]PZW76592.1 virus tail fiber assembly protein lambda gpK [Pseudomonas sp. 2848]